MRLFVALKGSALKLLEVGVAHVNLADDADLRLPYTCIATRKAPAHETVELLTHATRVSKIHVRKRVRTLRVFGANTVSLLNRSMAFQKGTLVTRRPTPSPSSKVRVTRKAPMG